MNKNDIFVKHIEDHLKDMNIKGKVMCKICNKDIDTIYEETKKHQIVTIFIDGSCKGNPGPGKALALFRAEKEWKKEKILNSTTNNIAEYEALLLALEELKMEVSYLTLTESNKVLDITIYTDSKLIEGHINKNWKVNTNLELVNKAKYLVKEINKNHNIKIEWVPRDKNEAGILLESEI